MPIDLKISQLTDGTIIQVTDEIPVSRGGANRRVKVGALAALDSLSKADVGLANVNNTSDANKQISIATQAALDNKLETSLKGAVNGLAELDASGKLPVSQLTISAMEYKGTWNVTTNTPTLANGTGNTGDTYIVSPSAGTRNLGSGNITFTVNDLVIYSGTIWQRVPNPNSVNSVFGRTGLVVAQSNDYNAGQVSNTPSGGISSLNVQAAINELALEKINTSEIGVSVQPYNANSVLLDVAQQFTKQHSFLQTTLASGVPINWNLDDNQNASVILTNTTYLLPVNIKNGADYTLTVKQDAVGSRVILFSNLFFKFPSGVAPVLSTTPNSTDVLKFTASNGVLLLTNFDKNLISESNAISSRSPAFWINGENVVMSGSNVVQVNDMGTLGYNLTAGSGNTTISNINGLPALNFGTTVETNMQRTGVLGSDISTLNAMTIFIVQKILATGSQNWAFNWDSTSGLTPTNDILIGSPDAAAGAQRARWLYGNFSNATNSLLADVTNINVNPKVLCFLKRSNNLGSIYENNNLVLSGTMNGTITLADSGTLSVGAGKSFAGQFKGLIAEVIVFKTTLLSTDIAAVNQYLQNKYNIF